MNGVWGVMGGLGFGLGSSIVPLFNAETYVVASVAAQPWLVAPLVLAVALGQTSGKMLIFEAARRGSSRIVIGHRVKSQRLLDASAKLGTALTERRSAVPVVFIAATVGLPPLALVSVASGSAHQNRMTFAATCLLGRTLRFSALAVPVLAVLST